MVKTGTTSTWNNENNKLEELKGKEERDKAERERDKEGKKTRQAEDLPKTNSVLLLASPSSAVQRCFYALVHA